MFLSNRSIGLFVVALGVFTLFQCFTHLYFGSAIAISIFAGMFLKFVQDLGNRIEIRDIIAFMAILQWLVGPVLAYNVLPYDDLYWMDVSEEQYMAYMVPLCLFMLLGLYFPLTDDRLILKEDLDRAGEYINAHPMVGYIMTGVGVVAGMAGKFLPSSLTFLMFLVTNLQYVGVYMILFGNTKFKWIIFGVVMGMATFGAVLQGMFGELVQWFILSFLVVSILFKMPMWAKSIMIIFGLGVMSLVQSTKDEYRKATWYANSDKTNDQIYKEILMQRLSSPGFLFEPAVVNNMGARLNQGWIIARIMGHMPEKYDFVRGETVQTALVAALLPRFLAPNKAKAGGKANFERFTGTVLPETTSMDISLAGEGYANFGVVGGWFFIFFVSLFYNWVIIKIISLSKNNPTLVLWIPFLFFQPMKAETDFATVFNYLTKAALVAFLVFYITKLIMEWTKGKEPISANPDRMTPEIT